MKITIFFTFFFQLPGLYVQPHMQLFIIIIILCCVSRKLLIFDNFMMFVIAWRPLLI